MRSRGYRVTPQREAILEVMEENEGRPLDPERVHELAREKLPGLGLATVYRTLDLYSDLGIVFPVHLHEDSQHYEINAGGHHHHMVCLSCGTVRILEACMIDELMEAVRDDSDFLVTSHCMSLFGYCPECLRSGRYRRGEEGK